jgi:electron transport complex protein RnfG
MSRATWIHASILGAFCLGFGVVLAVTDQQTNDDIKQRVLEDKQCSLSQVLPTAIHDNSPVANVITLKDAKGEDVTVYRATKGGVVTGVAYLITGSGSAGPIRLMLGVDAQGKILGVRVVTHKETPGLGDKIQTNKGDWILRFDGLSLGNPTLDKWKVKKDGGQFDQFSGATITPRGVVGAIREGLHFFDEQKTKLLEAS